jgi:hypothetical protein
LDASKAHQSPSIDFILSAARIQPFVRFSTLTIAGSIIRRSGSSPMSRILHDSRFLNPSMAIRLWVHMIATIPLLARDCNSLSRSLQTSSSLSPAIHPFSAQASALGGLLITTAAITNAGATRATTALAITGSLLFLVLISAILIFILFAWRSRDSESGSMVYEDSPDEGIPELEDLDIASNEFEGHELLNILSHGSSEDNGVSARRQSSG